MHVPVFTGLSRGARTTPNPVFQPESLHKRGLFQHDRRDAMRVEVGLRGYHSLAQKRCVKLHVFCPETRALTQAYTLIPDLPDVERI